MKRISDYLKNIRLIITRYIYTNRLFLTYVILALCGAIILRNITVGNSSIKPFFTDLGFILLIGSFGYMVKPKNQFKYCFIWLIIFTVLETVNSVYFTFYESFGSVAELSTMSQAETVTDAIFEQLRLVDFIYILQPLVFYYVHKNLKTSSYYNIIAKIESTKKMMLTSICFALIFLSYSFATAEGKDYSRLAKQWNRSYIVERFGIIMYQFNDVFQTIMPKISSMFGYEEAYELFNDYYENNRITYNGENKYTGILEGYNIVYVHMESMQNFLMDLEFNGEKVTPNLNKLASEGLFFSNFYPQVSTGTSSDAEYMMLTGLLPAISGTVFVTYADNTFLSLPNYLQDIGYYTFSMHGNYSSMWNRNKVHPRLGYQELYYRDTFEFDPKTDTVGLGINDKLFFKQAIEKLEKIEETYFNYFGTIITLSNHSPFKLHESFSLDISDYYKDENGKEVSTCYLCNRDIGEYIISSNYADEALGEFLEAINKSDSFDNTVFIFYGDHDAKMSYKDMNYLYNYDYLTGELKNENDEGYINYDNYDYQLDKKTPLIMWTKNKRLQRKLKGEVDTIMGMYDTAPTLYNMLDIDVKYVLGHDIFNIKDDNIVVYPNGNYLTDKVYYNNSTGEYKILKDDVILDTKYVNNKLIEAEQALEVGNAIVMYDLFNEKKRISMLED